ncbi:MAG: TlpA family protein disulfide reductase [Nitrospirae bacterium]|nr:TlpA family protein disulfide reductase [Nitrospirota bacterium]
MKRTVGLALLGAIAIAFIVIFGHGLTQDPRAIPSPLVGYPAPRFSLPKIGGGTLRIEDYAGKGVVVNFWASWCLPCRDEARVLEMVSRGYAEKNVVVVGINMQDEDASAQKFITEEEITFPNGRDAEGKTAIDFGVYGVPETFFIDSAGRVAHKVVGPVHADSIIEGLKKIAPGEAG